MAAINVGFDIGPLHGERTGIGFAVAAMHDALQMRSDVELTDYLVSFRSRPAGGTRRLPIPAAIAHRLWAHGQWPKADRWLPGASVVHGTNYVVPPTTAPRLVSVYDCWFLRHPGRARPAVRRAGRVLRQAIDAGAVVHTSSHATERAIRDLIPGARVVTIHLGPLTLPPPPVHAPIPDLDGVPFVLALGTLERRKNLPALVRAFGDLAADLPEVQLVLAGSDGDDRPAIDTAVDALGRLSNRVSFTGRVGEEARSWLLHNASVLAYPSLDEGFGFPLLDAMQARVPIIASNAGSIPEVAGDAALLCAPDDTAALAANLHAAITETATREQLQRAADVQWRGFTWQKCAAELVTIYQRLALGETEPWS